MKKKHRLDKLLHSVFGNHSDDENSEALPNREEIDKNVEKILKMLQTEESGSISSESSFNKFELASLIDGFHKRYQVVQRRYDHLIGKLKKEVRSESNDNGSFSVDFTSSDSEDSDSGSEELSDKGKLENMKIKNIELETMIIEMSAKLKAEKTSAAELTESAKLLRTEMDVLRTKLEASRKKEEDMNQKTQNLYEENDSLRSENAEAFCKIHEANKSLKEFQIELNRIKDDMERVKSENNTLKEELERTSNDVASSNQQLISTNEEKEALRSGNFKFLRRTEEAEKALAALRDNADQKLKLVEELTSQNTHLTSENENLRLRLDSDLTDEMQPAEKAIDDLKAGGEQQGNDTSQLQEKINDLTLELEVTNFQLHGLNRELNAAKEEKNALSLEVSEILTKLKQSESKQEELENERAHFREKFSTLHQYQSKVQEAEKIIDDLKGKVEQLTADNSQLKANVVDLSVELEASKLQLTDTNKAEVRNLEVSSIQQAETEVRNLENDGIQMAEVNSMLHRSLQEAELNDLSLEMEAVTPQLIDPNKVTEASEEENTSLTSEIETLKVELGKLQEANAILEQKQNELLHQKFHLEEKLGEKEKERSNLEESYKDVLKKLELTIKEKADKDRENAKLYKRAENFEVQLRLSNQMIKITETECNEKIEEYKQAMEEMVEDRKEMEDHMLKICIKMNYLENELRHFKGFAEDGIPDLIRRYNELDSAFVLNSSHISKKIYMFSEEIKVMKKWVVEMKNENQELLVRVKYQEGIMSIMKDELESIVDKLVNKEKEVSVLRAHVIESEERMKVLEEMLRDKKKEVLDKDEAKREVIRQLCLLIDYHRENNDHLCKYLSSVLKSKTR